MKIHASFVGALVIVLLFSYESSWSASPKEVAPIEIPSAALGTSNLRSEAPEATDIIQLREIGGAFGAGLNVSPNGKYVAFEVHQANVERNEYSVAWFIAPLEPDSLPVHVGDGGDPTLFKSASGAWVSEYPKWSPDSRGIAYRKRVAGATQIWWSSRNGDVQRPLTRNAADVEEFYWSGDGSRLVFTTDADRDALQALDVSRSRDGHLFDYETDWSTIEATPRFPPYALLPDSKPRIWVYDVRLQEERLATSDEIAEYDRLVEARDADSLPAKSRHAVHSGDAQGLVWLQPDDPDNQGWWPPMTLYASFSPDGSDPQRCPAPECTGLFDVHRPLREGLSWHGSGSEVLFVRYEGTAYSKRTIYGWNPGDQTVRRILSTDEWISDCTVLVDRAVCFRETPTTPRSVVTVQLDTGDLTTVVDPNPGFGRLNIGSVELFEWTSSLNWDSFGYLVKPPDYDSRNRYPMVIVGYRARTALRGGTGNEYPVHLLAQQGFVVLVYDRPENHEAYAKYTEYVDLVKADWGPDLFDYRMPLASFESAVRILSEQGIVDPTRVGITGLSNGVGHVNYSIINSDLFAAAITSSSGFGPSAYFLGGAWNPLTQQARRALGTGRYGTPYGTAWPIASLSLNAERVNTPLLVNSADQEYLPALEEVTALIENRAPVELHVYPDEGHIKWRPAHRQSIFERNVDWFNFWLRDFEDPAPAKSAQYERWRELRKQRSARSGTESNQGAARTE